MSRYDDISGVVLAGGKGSRIGFDKKSLSLNSQRVIERTEAMLNSLFAETLIVTEKEDLIKGCGPLSGIYTGLKLISHDLGFFVACDMPFLQADFISRIIDAARVDRQSCLIPRSERGLEPLHAVYAKSSLADLKSCLEKKQFSIRQFLKSCRCNYLETSKKEQNSFVNINTLQELQEASGE